MSFPIQITFHDLDNSAAVEASLKDKFSKLSTFYSRILSCHITIDVPHRHHLHGKSCVVHANVKVPGDEIVVTGESSEGEVDTGIRNAAHDAFAAARRKLEDFARRSRKDIKVHPGISHGRIRDIFPDQSFGFIESSDGREIYFHEHSVPHEKFESLSIGAEVSFTEENGIEGPQASNIKLI